MSKKLALTRCFKPIPCINVPHTKGCSDAELTRADPSQQVLVARPSTSSSITTPVAVIELNEENVAGTAKTLTIHRSTPPQ